jgi:uncharacterized protein
MKLHDYRIGSPAWPRFGAVPSVTMRQGVSPHLPRLAYLRERMKLHARAFYHGGHTRTWLGILNSHPAFSEYVNQHPRLLIKIYRPYLTETLDMAARMEAIRSHYAFIFRHGLDELVAQASRAGAPLAAIEGKTGLQYQVMLRAISPFEREGELVLQLKLDDVLVYSLAFAFSGLDGGASVSIGCIQGPNHEAGQEAIRRATKELHGLRPKQLLLQLVSELSHALGFRQLRLVGNRNRPIENAVRQGRVWADYDQFWLEMGAAQRPDGDFVMACRPVPAPDLERICSKKRSEARKRYQLSAGVADEVTRHFVQA